MTAVWAGIDAGKRTHYCVVVDGSGHVQLSQRVANDETALLELIGQVSDLAGGYEVCWATDLNTGGASLLIALLDTHGQRVVYIPGRVIHHAAETYRGDSKTDAKDARIIADQARMRADLRPVGTADQISTDLQMLTSRRTDVVHDRVRVINRLRATLLEYFPALESAFDFSNHKGALLVLSGYQTPEALRRVGVSRLASWLTKRGCRASETVAQTAVDAAHRQHTVLASQTTGAQMVQRLAAQIGEIDTELADLDRQIANRFAGHETAGILESMPGFGTLLAATFIAQIGGSLANFDSVDRLASVAGLAPAPRDSGRVSGNLHRPKRFNRRLLRTCYLAALSSLKNSPASKTFYDRKRTEGKSHKQAIIALARRRNNVIWAMLRDGTYYHEPTRHRPPLAA